MVYGVCIWRESRQVPRELTHDYFDALVFSVPSRQKGLGRINLRMLEIGFESRNRLTREWTIQRADFGNAMASLDHVRPQPRSLASAINQITRLGFAILDWARLLAITAARAKDGCRQRARLKLVERATVALLAVHDVENGCHWLLIPFGKIKRGAETIQSLHLASVQSSALLTRCLRSRHRQGVRQFP